MGVSPEKAARAIAQYKARMPAALMRGLRKGMPHVIRYAKTKYMVRKNNRHPFKAYDPPEPPPGPLGIRQGNLARSIKLGPMRYNGRFITASIMAGGPEVPYAKVHEFGMKIRAKNGPNLIFFSNVGRGPFKVMKPSVIIPARPYLRPAVRDAQPEILEAIRSELRILGRATLRGVARMR